MKKICVILMCILMLLSFSISAFAAEFTDERIKFTLPDELIQDTTWAEENGYINSWYNEDNTLEIMYYIDKTEMGYLPRFLEDEKDFNLCRRYTATEVYSSESTWHNEGEHTFNGNVCTYSIYDILENETPYIHMYEYAFPVNDSASYVLLFVDYTGEHRDEAREIIGTVNIDKFSVTDSVIVICAVACVGVLAAVLIVCKRNKKLKAELI